MELWDSSVAAVVYATLPKIASTTATFRRTNPVVRRRPRCSNLLVMLTKMFTKSTVGSKNRAVLIL
jgi:hypothetical protein